MKPWEMGVVGKSVGLPKLGQISKSRRGGDKVQTRDPPSPLHMISESLNYISRVDDHIRRRS